MAESKLSLKILKSNYSIRSAISYSGLHNIFVCHHLNMADRTAEKYLVGMLNQKYLHLNLKIILCIQCVQLNLFTSHVCMRPCKPLLTKKQRVHPSQRGHLNRGREVMYQALVLAADMIDRGRGRGRVSCRDRRKKNMLKVKEFPNRIKFYEVLGHKTVLGFSVKFWLFDSRSFKNRERTHKITNESNLFCCFKTFPTNKLLIRKKKKKKVRKEGLWHLLWFLTFA